MTTLERLRNFDELLEQLTRQLNDFSANDVLASNIENARAAVVSARETLLSRATEEELNQYAATRHASGSGARTHVGKTPPIKPQFP
jgi:hypothetical protein